ATERVAATIASGGSDRGIGTAITECVSAEHPVVEVIVRIGPERVICIGVERVIDEVVVCVGPEQWADPADYDRVGKMAPPLRVEEPALERRVRERARTGIAGIGQVGKSLIAQDAAGEGARVASHPGAGRRSDAARLLNCALLRS